METITFYSYKGGVGRTLALANVAIYLSRFGQSVCIMDFDLEAPGLHYKFPQRVKTTDIRSGLVDYICEFTNNAVIPESLDKFTVELVPSSESQSRIQLIPAGNVLSSEYWLKLASIDWNGLFYARDSEGVPFFLGLKEKIRREFEPDFLLIDSRTGITEMSGLCTSLLPDRVVFLIVNNQENIEGARQILRGIQKVERFPGQKPIELTFALTRIPFPEEEKEEEIEKQIIKDIQDFLNEPEEDLENQLDIRDICVLHSDRELELSESLRMSRERIAEETPLSRDYLRLFSKIIPDKVIVPKLDSILDKITANIWDDPDKTQKELEGLVASYLHPKSLEKLVDFYIIRNEENGKIIDTMHKLWEISTTFSPRILSRYISIFMRGGRFFPWVKPRFNLEIIEEYLDLNPDNRIEVELKLAEAYEKYGKPEMALQHYCQLIEEGKEEKTILGKMLDIYIDKESYDDAMKLFEGYPDIIESDLSLRTKKVEVMFKTGSIEEVQKLLDDDKVIEENIFNEKPSLYFSLMERLGRLDEANKRLTVMLNETLARGSPRQLLEVGEIFDRLGRADEFKNRISGKHPDADAILHELDRARRRFL